ncbi:alpha/beta fold hydrolase [Nesterenkonia haasae]|uniref:alpha/beta fold hydrolase n=1 Tax=Nesterenkonia haasae TaxID=2587813 RepID=UPI0013913B66|nr:alpha/beta hydrolase [Nesterenkonia haasae]NDK30306.1 alpha/beta hydrolase [Nesterenkonia haasae]
MAHFILIPGLWLDAGSWHEVTPPLVAAGHSTHSLTLPNDRETTLQDWVDAVVLAIDSAPEPPVLVGHSAGCGLAYAAADARADAVRHLVLIGGFPLPDGMPLLDQQFPDAEGFVSLPDFSAFGPADLAGLDDAALDQFRANAVSVPAQVLAGTLHLSHPERHYIPLTAVCTEYSTADLTDWIKAGFPPTTEFPHFADASYIDLSTGHWPQFSRPEDAAKILLRINEQPTSATTCN